MTYLNARRRAEIMTVIMVFQDIVNQCIIQGDECHREPLIKVMTLFNLAHAEALAGLNEPEVQKALRRARAATYAIMAEWVEHNAAANRVYLMAHIWLQKRIADGHFQLSDGPFLEGYNMFAAMIEANEPDMERLSDPRLQRSALKGVSKLDAAFRERFGAGGV